MIDFFMLFLEFLLFLASLYFFFYIPGRLLFFYGKAKMEYPASIFLPLVTGIIIFTIFIYSASWVHLQILIYPFAFGALFLGWKRKILSLPTIPPNHKKASLLTAFLAILFSAQMIFNGNFGNSIYFFGDDLAHLAYMTELRHAFPPQNPGFAGIPLNGYHFFYDFLNANLSQVTLLSPFSLYFHFMPLLTAFGWAFGTYALLFQWTKKISAALWGVFLVLFGSSFSFVLLIINHPKASIFNNFGIDQPSMALLNAPYAFSIVIVLATLLCMHNYLKNNNKTMLILIGIFVGIAPEFKVYAGMILIGGFAVFTLIELLKKKFTVLYAGIVAFVLFLATFKVFSSNGAGLFYLPLWPIERMLDQIFPEYGYKEKIDTYKKYSVIKGLFLTHLYTFSVFLIGNIGTRFIGILFLPIILMKSKKLPSAFSLIVLSMLLLSIFVPMFFAQTIKVFEMIQMTWYYPFFVSLFAALGLAAFFSLRIPKIIKVILTILIISFTLPLTYYNTVKNVIPLITTTRQPFTSEYFQTMNYLKTHGTYDDIVLELPADPSFVKVVNLNGWFNNSSPDIPVFGNKRVYVINQYNIFPNMPVEKRLAFLAAINKVEFTKNRAPQGVKKIIKEIKDKNISYIYTNQPITFFTHNKAFSLVLKNSQALIYKVN